MRFLELTQACPVISAGSNRLQGGMKTQASDYAAILLVMSITIGFLKK
jgi:hypothetical protein